MGIGDLGVRAVRSMASYVPSRSLLGLRELRDLPARAMGRVHEHDFRALSHFDRHPSTVLDVGANRGQSIRSLRLVLDHPCVVAVEPHRHLATHLHRRFPDVRVENVGLGDRRGRLDLHVPVYGHTAWDTRAAGERGLAEEFLAPESFLAFSPTRARVVLEAVDLVPMDDLDVDPDIIKVDVEGADLAALQGGERTIARCRPVLLVEHPAPGSTALLAAFGYRAFTFTRDRLVLGATDSLNTFFLTEDHVARVPAGMLDLTVR